MPSLIIAELPVMLPATNLMTAMAALPMIAAITAFLDSAAMRASVSPGGATRSSSSSLGLGTMCLEVRPVPALRADRRGGTNREECAMLLVLAVLIFIGAIIWRILRLEARSREQAVVIEELHQRVWQLEDLVAILHQNRESHSE